jgi:hypothetical protein
MTPFVLISALLDEPPHLRPHERVRLGKFASDDDVGRASGARLCAGSRTSGPLAAVPARTDGCASPSVISCADL